MQPQEPRISRLQRWALRLNRRQVRVLVLGLCGCLLFAGWQPWDFVYYNQVGGTRAVWAGFHVGAPTPPEDPLQRAVPRLNWPLWLALEAACVAVTAGFILTLRDKNDEANASYGAYR